MDIKKLAGTFRLDLLTKPFYSGVGSILMFHRILPRDKGSVLSSNRTMEVTPETFESVIRFLLERKYQFISLDTMVSRLSQKKISGKFVVLTFDDGYWDNLLYAYPICKRLGVPMNIYVTTAFPDFTAVLWWYLLEDLLVKQERVEFSYQNRLHSFSLKTLAEKNGAFTDIRRKILNANSQEYPLLLDAIFKPYGLSLTAKVRELALSWPDIMTLSEDPLVTIGAHTKNHFSLAQLSENDAFGEILLGKKILERKLSKPIHHFAYPYGTAKDTGPRERLLVAQSEFVTATTTRAGNIFSGHKDNLLSLPRIVVTEEKFAEQTQGLKLYLNGLSPCIKNKFKRVITL